MEKQNSKIIEFSFYLKKKIYKEFKTKLFKEFNMTVSDINNIYGYERNHLFVVLEEAFDESGAHKMRLEIDYTIQSFQLDFNKNINNII